MILLFKQYKDQKVHWKNNKIKFKAVDKITELRKTASAISVMIHK